MINRHFKFLGTKTISKFLYSVEIIEPLQYMITQTNFKNGIYLECGVELNHFVTVE